MNTTETFTEGQTLYWRRYPKAKFKFIKINKDNSVQMSGGEPGYSSGRDAVTDEIQTFPFDGLEQVNHWAIHNVYVEITVAELAKQFDLKESAVRKFVTDKPDVFKRLSHGKYEVRDPKSDRAHAQSKANQEDNQ
jgi:hypothetical protein